MQSHKAMLNKKRNTCDAQKPIARQVQNIDQKKQTRESDKHQKRMELTSSKLNKQTQSWNWKLKQSAMRCELRAKADKLKNTVYKKNIEVHNVMQKKDRGERRGAIYGAGQIKLRSIYRSLPTDQSSLSGGVRLWLVFFCGQKGFFLVPGRGNLKCAWMGLIVLPRVFVTFI